MMAPSVDLPVQADSLPAERIALRPVRSRGFFLAITFVLIAMVLRGFWPSYFGQLFSDAPERPWIMQLHGAVFSGWMVLFLVQVSLIYGKRVRTHRTLGNRVGIAYGASVLALGLVVSFVAPILHVRAGDWTLDRAAGFILLPLVDMVLFAGFFGAAIAYRAKPDIHKRLMLVATIAVVFAAMARIGFESQWVFLLVWLSPLIAAMGFDWLTRRQVHRVYVLSLAILVAAFARLFLMQSEGWLRIGRALLVPLI
jgi:hypothetical protein